MPKYAKFKRHLMEYSRAILDHSLVPEKYRYVSIVGKWKCIKSFFFVEQSISKSCDILETHHF